MRHLLIVTAMLSASNAAAGGFEASRLDTKFMYEEGNYAEFSNATINYDVKPSNLTLPAAAGGPVYKTESSVRDQKRVAMAFKSRVGNLDIGLTDFQSGTIQLEGAAATFGLAASGWASGVGTVPDTDVTMRTQTLMGKYGVSNNLDVLFGLNRNVLDKSVVTTSRGTYNISKKSSTGTVFGVAYSKPEIALRVELLAQPKADMTSGSSYVASNYGVTKINAGTCAAGSNTATFDTSLSRPETLTLNIQSGVAKDTLAYGTIHRTSWGSSQITAPTGCDDTKIVSAFWDTTTYTIGIARKLSEQLSLTGAFSKETGGNATSTSLFTVNNGYTGINIGAQYKIGKLKLSGGYNYVKLGDVRITDGTNDFATYTGNKVGAFGFKVGVNF